jgi:hypothetical protein
VEVTPEDTVESVADRVAKAWEETGPNRAG